MEPSDGHYLPLKNYLEEKAGSRIYFISEVLPEGRWPNSPRR
jgi:hypothetical protein